VEALAQSGNAISRLRVGLCASKGHTYDGLYLEAVQYTATRALNAAPSMANLQDLDLSVEILEWRREYDRKCLTKLLTCTTNLKKLRLELWYDKDTKQECSAMYSDMLERANLPKLESLRLVKGTCRGAAFSVFLDRHRARLKDLLLHKIVFREIEWEATLRQVIETDCQDLETLSLRWTGVERGVIRADDDVLSSDIDLCEHYRNGEEDGQCHGCAQIRVEVVGTLAVREALLRRLPVLRIHGWRHEFP